MGPIIAKKVPVLKESLLYFQKWFLPGKREPMQLGQWCFFKSQDFSTRLSYYFWCFFAFILSPLTLHPRFFDLNNPLIEPHPWRQNQTALTAYYFSKGFGTLFDYRSPYEGKLWNYVIEFPLYQWIVSKIMAFGFSLEVAGKCTSLFFFMLGTVFLYKVVKRILTKEIALWTAVLYWISPFNILYSRTVLIDLMVQCFCLMCAYYTVCMLQEQNKKKYFFLSVLFGVLGGTGKITIWFSLALAVFFYLAYSKLVKKEEMKRYSLLLLSFFIQGCFTVGWMAWSNHIYKMTGAVNEPSWFFGELSQRVSLWRYERLLHTVVRVVLLDFMLVPFLFAFVTSKEKLLRNFLLLLVVSIPVFILFNIHVHHDYYFVTETPYLFVLVGIGMVQLFQLKNKKVLYGCLALSAVLLALRLDKFNAIFEVIYHDFRPKIADSLKLKSFTTEKDLIYFQSDVIGRFDIPFYSERSVLLGPTRFFGKNADPKISLKPNVFWLETPEAYEELVSYPSFYLVSDGSSFYILRELTEMSTEPVVSISSLSSAKAKILNSNKNEINLCQFKNSQVFRVPENIKRVELYSKATKHTYILPARPYLSIPPESILGCSFTVSFIL